MYSTYSTIKAMPRMAFNTKMNRQNQNLDSKEEYAIVLDIIFNNQDSFKDNEVVQAVGVTNYTLLELIPKPGVILKAGEKVYIGEGKRDSVQYIKRSVGIEKLSPSAKSELSFVLVEIIRTKEEEFVNFFNIANPITIRKHALELVAGVGKKYLDELLYERDEKGSFKSFDDIRQRCPFLQDPAKSIAHRILDEIEGKDSFKFFLRK